MEKLYRIEELCTDGWTLVGEDAVKLTRDQAKARLDVAIAEGYDHHWVMDDNITSFRRFNKNEKVKVSTGAIFVAMEDFVLRYKNIGMSDFFNKDEVVFYSSINDLSNKINFYSRNDKIRSQIAKNGKTKYFKLFNESKISKFIINISLGNKSTLF